jgi:5-methyltetrahydrofolate--homocysteine methyltransferase
MDKLLEKIAVCVDKGKVNAQSPHYPEMKGQDGVDELILKALETGISGNTRFC